MRYVRFDGKFYIASPSKKRHDGVEYATIERPDEGVRDLRNDLLSVASREDYEKSITKSPAVVDVSVSKSVDSTTDGGTLQPLPASENVYACDLCNLTYKNKGALGLHKNRKHG